jgi:hypothetical protein
MNREQYIDALTFCFQAETAGAIAGEVAMLLRSDADERRKLDLFRRVEAIPASTRRCSSTLSRMNTHCCDLFRKNARDEAPTRRPSWKAC